MKKHTVKSQLHVPDGKEFAACAAQTHLALIGEYLTVHLTLTQQRNVLEEMIRLLSSGE